VPDPPFAEVVPPVPPLSVLVEQATVETSIPSSKWYFIRTLSQSAE
jgi:hypothetical protein